jgi:glycosyltransferase involved in cell wall biosynthesis
MPALNEEKTILNVINSIPKTIDGIDNIDILVINDGSTDQTEAEAKKGGATVLSHNENKGVGTAFQTAINYALQTKTDILVSIDADGQFDVNQIPEILTPILNNQADFCIGIRFSKGKPNNMSKIKFWGNKKVNKIMSFASNAKIHDASCGFRAYSNDALLSLNLHGSFTYT